MRPERVTDTFAIATWRRLTMWVVDGHTPLEELERLRHLVMRWVAAHPAKTVSLIVIHGTPTTMSAEERRSVTKMIDDTKHTRVASATVILGRGMVGSLHRSILTGFSLLVPPPHPTRICADVDAAIGFLHPHIVEVCGPVEPFEVAAMLGDLHGEVCAEKLRRSG